MVFFEVNLGGEKNIKIGLYANSDPEKVAQRFALKHKVDKELEANLGGILSEQLSNALKNDESMGSGSD